MDIQSMSLVSRDDTVFYFNSMARTLIKTIVKDIEKSPYLFPHHYGEIPIMYYTLEDKDGGIYTKVLWNEMFFNREEGERAMVDYYNGVLKFMKINNYSGEEKAYKEIEELINKLTLHLSKKKRS